MREIKFRCWNKRLKKFVLIRTFLSSDGKHYLNCDSYGVDMSNKIRIIPTDDLEFTFYTGLKDKNGVEIYDGDIVEAWMYEDEIDILPIYFGDGGFLIDFQDSESDLTLLGWFIANRGNIKVIGNIYENPELLDT